MNEFPLEIERKYLVKIPNMNIIKQQENYQDQEIIQMYLAGKGFNGMRIRKSTYNGTQNFKKTIKKDITALKRIEIEENITREEFEKLSLMRNPKYLPIHKHRHSFSYRGQVIELDIYDFWQDRATVEVEMKNETQVVELPSFIEVIKEVTDDPRYRNRSLAKKVIFEEI